MSDGNPREPAPRPPKGFRKAIPLHVKLQVALAAMGLAESDIDWDHDPPIQLRVWDEAAQDTVPPCNDPAHIRIRIKADHRVKTSGAPTRAHNRGADVTEIRRTDRLAEEQAAFRNRLLAKGTPKAEPPPKRKRPWNTSSPTSSPRRRR